MAKVTVQPSGIEFTVEDGEAVMAAAKRQGFKWPTVCGGMGQCQTCYVHVLEGAEHLSPVKSVEAEGLENLLHALDRDSGPVRLACQLRIGGDVLLKKVGVRIAGD